MAFEVKLQPSGKTFMVEDGKSILTAALDAGISLAYSCRAGMCGTCKAVIASGEIDHGESSFSYLSAQERQSGVAMLCQARARSSLVVEAAELPMHDIVQPRITPARVAKLDKVADDVMVLKVRVPMNENLRFVAGQYIDVLLPGDERRSYSIATPPATEGVNELEFHIRHMPGGLFTDHVFSAMKLREILTLEGPFGTFFLREDSPKPIVCVASGTGAAPMQSMLEHIFKSGINQTRPVHFYWGGRTRNCLYMANLMSRWQEQHRNFSFIPVLSEATEQCQWSGRTGFVHQAVMQDFPDLSGHQVYACGSPAMVNAARSDFIQHRQLPETEFFADEFLSAADRAMTTAA